jgi:hypothetical protein
MSLTKNYYFDQLGFDTNSIYDDVEYNNPPLDLFSDEIQCEFTDQQIYEAELLFDYLREAGNI